jgi:multimeric flavodoxin WrbA
MSKVLLVNAGPHKEGNTMAALSEVAKHLEKNGVIINSNLHAR